MRIEDIKINGIENPVRFRTGSLEIVLEGCGKAYLKGRRMFLSRISDKADFSKCIWKKQGADLDCTGQEIAVRVEPYTRYYCRVTVTGDAGDLGCGTCFFRKGKMENSMGW